VNRSIDDVLTWILGFGDPVRGVGWNPRANQDEYWKLRRVRWLLDHLGAPDRTLRIVTIAGTNGKGSTGALVDSILRAARWRVGAFAQPHLHHLQERVRLDGVDLPDGAFVASAGPVVQAVDALRQALPDAGDPTAFELLLVLACIAFAHARVDAAIIEVGLGGRLDPVNALDPSLCILTAIGHDHTHLLGNRLTEIATEKCGILRSGVSLVSSRQRPGVTRLVRRLARERGARLIVARPLDVVPDRPSIPGTGQFVRLPADLDGEACLALLGAHQRQNAAIAVAAARELGALDSGEAATTAARGLASARWPGRLEWVAGDPPILIDGAHNRDGAAALAAALDEIVPDRIILPIVGCARDKDPQAIIRPLARRARHFWAVAADDPRALDAGILAATVRRFGATATVTSSVAVALADARAAASETGAVIVVYGSLRMVADARTALGLAGAPTATE
jgi:dihydrofolate synthase/folylpolyglutamate synthase